MIDSFEWSHIQGLGRFILILFFFLSIFSGALGVSKARQLRVNWLENQKFLSLFSSLHLKGLEEVFSGAKRWKKCVLFILAESSLKELRKQGESGTLFLPIPEQMEQVERALQKSSLEEIRNLERGLSWFATLASVAPFIGLLGTVWGILSAFKNIAKSGSASLLVVAPSISEALITTALGIGVAIPAVLCYNYFSNQLKEILVQIEIFSQDWLNWVQRSFFVKNSEYRSGDKKD